MWRTNVKSELNHFNQNDIGMCERTTYSQFWRIQFHFHFDVYFDAILCLCTLNLRISRDALTKYAIELWISRGFFCSLFAPFFSSFSALSLSSLSFSLMRLIIMAEYFKITAIHFGQFLLKRLHVIFNFFFYYILSLLNFFPHSPVQWPQSTILRLTFWTGGFNTVIKFISRLWWHFGLI